MRIESSSAISHDAAVEEKRESASSPSGTTCAVPMPDSILAQLPRRADAATPTLPRSDLRAKGKRVLEASSEGLGNSTAKRSRLDPPSGSRAASVKCAKSALFQSSSHQAGIVISDAPKASRNNLTAEIAYQILVSVSEGKLTRAADGA